MKKLSLFLLLALVLCIPFISNVKADEKEKVTIYFFRGEGCPHCAEAEEFFEKLAADDEYGKMFQIKDYEVWYDEDNAAFMEKVATALDTEVGGVPFIVIGEKYFPGYAASMDDQIKSTIKDAYNGGDYKDVVGNLENGTTNNKKTEEKKDESSPLVPIIIVSVIAVGTIIGLVFLTKERK